jgi:hypothetical protein
MRKYAAAICFGMAVVAIGKSIPLFVVLMTIAVALFAKAKRRESQAKSNAAG